MRFYPTYDEFVDLAEPGKLVTIFCEVPNDSLTPVAAFYKLYSNREIFLFESVTGSVQESRYSFLGIEPFLTFQVFPGPPAVARISFGNPPNTTDWSEDGQFIKSDDPFDALQCLIEAMPVVTDPRAPRFVGGAVGYIGYDAVRYVEQLTNPPLDDRQLPDISLDFYDSVVVFDHVENSIAITAHAKIPAELSQSAKEDNAAVLLQLYEAACQRIRQTYEQLSRSRSIKLYDVPKDLTLHRGFDRSNFAVPPQDARTRFEDAVRECKKYIVAGDIFQVVISQRFESTTFASPISIYRALRHINPSPYLFYLRTAGVCLVGSSPELMLRVEEGEMTVRPLAGTRRRGKTPEEDDRIAEELLNDEKERAEHVMLVDLGRNDVGRVAEFGSVHLPTIMDIERYSHVMHISSTVTGQLKEGLDAIDAMKACLPAGTVSGAPKIRAMEIIDSLEPNRRGPYAGAIGFLDFRGNLETCLALRTMVIHEKPAADENDPEKVRGNRVVHIQAGAGIVADSVPANEYEETINKAKAVLKAIEIAEQWRYPMAKTDKTVLSCIQPTAEMHIGNYFGAVKNWVDLQHTYRCIYGVVDLHAMTRLYDPVELRNNSRRMFIDLLACGIDPDTSVVFVQSMVPEHTELCWILSCFCSYGELSRMTQFKEKSQNIEDAGRSDDFVSAGLLLYPVLQAADILMYRASFVPVGKDQEQHLELARSIARRFNQRFGKDVFPEPQPLFSETPKIMSLVDPSKKMSKSDRAASERSFVGLFEDDKSIRKKIRSAVTDTGPETGEMSPGVQNMFEILRACDATDTFDSLKKDYDSGTLKYSVLKDSVADALIAVTSKLRHRRVEIEADQAWVDERLLEMADKAQDLARETLHEVKNLAGLPTLN